MKSTYVDGFVLAVLKKNVPAYRKLAKEAATMWIKFGAVDYKECLLDDANPMGMPLTFPKLIKVKPTEVVWFSFITYKSKADRKAINKKVMAYFSEKYPNAKDMPMPFDTKRMAAGGFKVEVSS